MDLSYISALFTLLPERRMIQSPTPGWSGFLAGQALAAAQWIIPEGHGAWVWQSCKKTARLSGDQQKRLPRCEWNLEYWEVWKRVFLELTERRDDERIHESAHRDARRALQVMQELESPVT